MFKTGNYVLQSDRSGVKNSDKQRNLIRSERLAKEYMLKGG